METVWQFRTRRFRVALELEFVPYEYDGDDDDGEIQRKLDCGDFVAFDSRVCVYLDGRRIAENWLSGSVYAADSVAEFWQAHRDANPMNRNCSTMRAAHGERVCICHYFPDMVREAIREARAVLANPPRMRAA